VGFFNWLRVRASGMARAGCALAWGAGLAHAGPAADCNQTKDLARQLRGCSAYLRLAQGSPENRATAHLNRANVYAMRHKFDRAFADYRAAIALDSKNALAYYNRGNAYFDTHQYRRAAADYTAAIELGADLALAYYNRGLARERMGDREAAAADFRRAQSLDPAGAIIKQRPERRR
jgi:tetratricopeptide (TPR) repeat protein